MPVLGHLPKIVKSGSPTFMLGCKQTLGPMFKVLVVPVSAWGGGGEAGAEGARLPEGGAWNCGLRSASTDTAVWACRLLKFVGLLYTMFHAPGHPGPCCRWRLDVRGRWSSRSPTCCAT